MNETYDLIIIGGSAAATSAGIYAARRGLNFKIITKEFGGEVATSGIIENWPGIIHTDGLQLSDMFLNHLKSLKVEPETGIEVESIKKQDDGLFCITAKTDGLASAADKVPALSDGELVEPGSKCDYLAKTLIVATGVHPRELNITGEKEMRGKGVSYCTVCDGPLFGGKVTAVIGGGNSALESALMLADIASKVYVLNKNPEFWGEQVMINNLKAKQNVEIIYNTNTTEIIGGEFVTGLKYVPTSKVGTQTDSVGDDVNRNVKELQAEGIFVHIGMIPNSGLVPAEVAKNEIGEIKVNANCETSLSGLYAAGDVTDVPHKQIVIAAGQGTIALLSVVNYLNKMQI